MTLSENYYTGSIRLCAKLTCPFQVMYSEGKWYHVDTHGISTKDHEAAPRQKEESTDENLSS
jgi:hypothetical protein